MMDKQAEREKMVGEKMERDGVSLNEALNVPYFNFFHQQKKKPLLSRVSVQSSECSPSSSSFSNGFCSSEDGSPYAAPSCEEAKYQTPNYHYLNGLGLDSKSTHDSHNINGLLVDEIDLSHNLYRMNIREEQNGDAKMKEFEMDPQGFGLVFGNDSLAESVQYNVKKYSPYGGFNNGGFDIEGYQSPPYGVPSSLDDDMKCTFNSLQGGFEKGVSDSRGSFFAHNQPNGLYSGSGWYNSPSDYLLEQRKEQGRSWSNMGIRLQNPSRTRLPNDALVCYQQYKTNSNDGRGAMDPFSSSQLNVYDPLYEAFLLKERNRAITENGLPQSLISMKDAGDIEAFCCEDSFIIEGKGLNYANHKGPDTLRTHKMNFFNDISVQDLRGKSIKLDSCTVYREGNKLDSCTVNGGICENGPRLSSYCTLPPVLSCNSSLCDLQSYIYVMAQDQNGCRLLQKIFEQGTSQDVQMIFNEIIDHVVDLTLKPFGNYLIQKFLDVCDEEQRLQIVLRMTKEPGQLVRICLNTYGTRVVQKLIDTLETRQQISLVVLALKPGSLDLIKDQNGNHVIQRCLQCLTDEDNKFIFDAAAKFCVDVATHRHGCCVMQRCIGHSKRKHRDKLITQVSKNGLLLAQDPFGNYVVQYIIELKTPSAIANLLSQFKGNYIHLSTQKFSSHVVEKCLKHFEESRPQIIHELLSVSHFEQLLQDPYANYVIQSALAITKGPLHSTLVEAVRPHNILRNSPYCKRIFSRNLLRK